jgi:hypothetical protein
MSRAGTRRRSGGSEHLVEVRERIAALLGAVVSLLIPTVGSRSQDATPAAVPAAV